MGDTSAMVLEIDLIANNPTSTNITSNNTNSSYAKTDDIITITMAYDEDIASTSTAIESNNAVDTCLLYTSPSPRDRQKSRMPSSA